ncbi:MAG: amidohydrolase family protein [Fimbriimonadaceae bacterium]
MDGRAIASETLRPAFAFINGRFESGLEFEFAEGRLVDIRANSHPAGAFLLSPAFVNAHSHTEYRAMQGQISEPDYWGWIRKLTELKKREDLSHVEQMARTAADENRRAGVALIAEHVDRVEAASGLLESGLGGVGFAELITVAEADDVEWKLEKVRAKALLIEEQWGQPVSVSPHAAYTVHEHVLSSLAQEPGFKSIHVAETPAERVWIANNVGQIAQFRQTFGLEISGSYRSVVEYLLSMTYGDTPIQFVHLCDADELDIEAISEKNISVAHCPRSNKRLGCPPAPIREMLDAGIMVGIGLDSPASSGPIDMLAEINAAISTAVTREKPISFEEVWNCATTMGAASMGISGWQIDPSSETNPPCIKVSLRDPSQPASVLAPGASVEWI